MCRDMGSMRTKEQHMRMVCDAWGQCGDMRMVCGGHGDGVHRDMESVCGRGGAWHQVGSMWVWRFSQNIFD